MTLVYVALAMLAKDALATLLVVAETRGRTWMAGMLDALGDLATVASMVFGAGEIIVHGWGWHAVQILAVMMACSLFGTACWTQLGRRIKANPAQPADGACSSPCNTG